MATQMRFLGLVSIYIVAACGSENQPAKRPPNQELSASTKSGATLPASQDATARSSEKGRGPSPSAPSSDNEALTLPPLGPSKLSWNAETFVESATFALIPLE